MKFVNLTPHAITVRLADGTDRTFAPSGTVARVATTPGVDLPDADGIPCRSAQTWGEVEGLPAPADDTVLIVSALVLVRVSRQDVFAPDTGSDAIRNDKGQIVAVRRLLRSC